MEFERFRELASRMWEEIPQVYREGVDALVVEHDALPHPELRGIYTLGECVTDGWPDGYSAEGEVRSRVLLYHGSFGALARLDPSFDWRAELWETILHELLHHREFAAGEDALDEYDRALDENFRRHAGLPFDPTFYRLVPADAHGFRRLESEVFVETTVDPDATDAVFPWRERRFTVRVPRTEAPLFVNPVNLAPGRLWVVVRRRRRWWSRLFGGRDAGREARELLRRALPAAGG